MLFICPLSCEAFLATIHLSQFLVFMPLVSVLSAFTTWLLHYVFYSHYSYVKLQSIKCSHDWFPCHCLAHVLYPFHDLHHFHSFWMQREYVKPQSKGHFHDCFPTHKVRHPWSTGRHTRQVSQFLPTWDQREHEELRCVGLFSSLTHSSSALSMIE